MSSDLGRLRFEEFETQIEADGRFEDLPPPLLSGSEHAASSAHVSESSLARPALQM